METNTTLDSNGTKPGNNAPDSYTLEQYAGEKRLPLDFLIRTCKLSTQPDWRGIPYLHIPYLGEDGRELTHRKRYGNKEFRWKKGTHARNQLYGLHLLPRIRALGRVLLVEGESDTQTLWYLGFPALGIRVESWERAKEMANNILRNQVQVNASDVNENAVQYIVDWVLSNQAYFGYAVSGTCYGILSEDKATAWIYPSHLDEALRRRGFNPSKTRQYLAEKGYITTGKAGGKRRYSVQKQINPSTRVRMVELRLDRCTTDSAESGHAESADIASMFQNPGEDEPLPLPC